MKYKCKNFKYEGKKYLVGEDERMPKVCKSVSYTDKNEPRVMVILINPILSDMEKSKELHRHIKRRRLEIFLKGVL